jgi:hypothetical protein
MFCNITSGEKFNSLQISFDISLPLWFSLYFGSLSFLFLSLTSIRCVMIYQVYKKFISYIFIENFDKMFATIHEIGLNSHYIMIVHIT